MPLWQYHCQDHLKGVIRIGYNIKELVRMDIESESFGPFSLPALRIIHFHGKDTQ
jgi:hypothetical protein